MKKSVQTVLILRLLLILFILSISRISLYIFNSSLFDGYSFGEIAHVYFMGFRFDISTLSIIASLLIVGNTLALPFRKHKIYQRLINTITILVVSIAVIFNLSDAIYYRFTLKRMTFDIFNFLEGNGGFVELIPTFIIDYWYIVLTGIFLLSGLIIFYRRIRLNDRVEKANFSFFLRNSIFFIMWTGLTVLGIRGGVQLVPLTIVSASLHAPSQLRPLVLNTPFTIIKSYGQAGLQKISYFDEKELEQVYSPIKSYEPLPNVPRNIKNVVVIILESFSSEHIGYLSKKKTYTPFLDSLFEKSLVFNATANGKRSIEGIPAILSSLPTLSNESFLNGPYAANQIEGLAMTLGENNYETAFFHGGKNGTMSFDAYTQASGFQTYYGLNEYPNAEDFDGNWGIWDEEYLSYFSEMTSDFPEPFLAAVFTLSSHHPYSIPEKYKGTLPNGKLEIQESIAYTDLALKKYFASAKEKDWFANTLFVIVADHTSEGSSAIYQNSLGQYSIPIAFYAPADSLLHMRSERFPVQQTDIFPSILHYLGISDSVLCFGNSVFQPAEHPFAVNYYNNIIQILDSSYLLQIEEDQAKALYLYREDSLLKSNKLEAENYSDLLRLQRGFEQQYNNRMIENRLRAKRDE